MESILQKNKNVCFLCGMNANLEPLDKHHVFEGACRSNSEGYGLTVYIHHCRCHIYGRNSVHGNAKINLKLKKFAQRKAMEYYGWSVEDFREKFYKNYI